MFSLDFFQNQPENLSSIFSFGNFHFASSMYVHSSRRIISLPHTCCRLFGTKCDKCSQCFSKTDYVMRAKTKIYHVECFRCCACMRRLETGDEFALRQDGLFCRHDHDVLEGGKHCTGATGIPGSENNNNASLTNNNHHLHPNDGSMSGKSSTLYIKRLNSLFRTRHVSNCKDIGVI